jgi:hypothetical protein
MLLRTCSSLPVVEASASAIGGGMGGGLEVWGMERWEGAGVVPGVDSSARVEAYVSAEDGISESESGGVRWRS